MRRHFSLRDIYCQEDALRHPDAQVRIAAVHHAVARLAPGQELPVLLRQRLADDDPAVARYALVELLQAGVSEAFEALWETLRKASPEEQLQWHKCLRNCSRFPFAVLLDDVCGLETIGGGTVTGTGRNAHPTADADLLALRELVQMSGDQFAVRARDGRWRQGMIRLLTSVHERLELLRRCYQGVVLQTPPGDLPGFLEAEDLLFQFGGEALVNGAACAPGREALFTAARDDPSAPAGVVYVLEDRPPGSEPAVPAFSPRPAGLVPGIVAERGADGRYEVWCADGESFSRAFADGDVALGQLVLVEPARESQARRAYPFGDRPLDAETVLVCKQAYLKRCRMIRNSLGMDLVRIPAVEFLMGSAEGDQSAYGFEKPQHRVRITKPFYLGVTPVTQEQYERVMGQNPSHFKRDPQRPVECASWEDAVEFCRRLSEREGQTYRLPTEAEWEYACRAGSQTKWCFGDDESKLTQYAWYAANAGGTTHAVKQKKPNAWGLYDMHGNVWEWCQDWYGQYAASPASDPCGPKSGSLRVIRGGGWGNGASICRAAFRNWNEPSNRSNLLGFRLARAVS